MPYVEAIARHYHKFLAPTSIEDLVGAGAEGLLVGINKFDPDRGVRLITYAGHWIRAKIYELVLADWRRGKTSLPGTRSSTFWRMRKDRARLRTLGYATEQAVELLAASHGFKPKHIRRIFRVYDTFDVPLDAPQTATGYEWTWADLLEAPGPSPYEEAARDELKARLGRALLCLDPRQRHVVEQRYLHAERTLQDVGLELGISRERVRQIEQRAFRKMRRVLMHETRERAEDDFSSRR